MTYKPFESIKDSFVEGKLNITPVNEIFLNFSYSYINNIENFKEICTSLIEIVNNSTHYEKKYYSGRRLNEMIMLNIAYIKNPDRFNLLKVLPEKDSEFIFDPGSYGQYLGGVDKHLFSKKYKNDKHYVGRNIIKYGYDIKLNEGLPVVISNKEEFKLVNLHIHKKNLRKFLAK